ncbi:MAG: helix-turn-helix transcriptional regulator [Promethearchaeota archaeon]
MPDSPMGRILDRYEIDSLIVECVIVNPDTNIELISKETGLSYTAVRNGLRRLISMGVLEQVQRSTGPRGRGRPARLFRLQKGLQIHIPPRQFQHITIVLIEQLLREEGPTRVKQLFQRSAQQEAAKLIELWKSEDSLPTTLDTMVKRVTDFLNHQGCNARKQTKEEIHYIRVYNCIYSDISIAYPNTICSYHFSFITSLIKSMNPKSTVSHKASMATGDSHCLYVIESH